MAALHRLALTRSTLDQHGESAGIVITDHLEV